jgi:hypothetical protein
MSLKIHLATGTSPDIAHELDRLFENWANLDEYADDLDRENEDANRRADEAAAKYDAAKALVEWCEHCYFQGRRNLATHTVTVARAPSSINKKYEDVLLCDVCEQAHQEYVVNWPTIEEADYRRTLADFEAGTGRI